MDFEEFEGSKREFFMVLKEGFSWFLGFLVPGWEYGTERERD